MELYHFDHNILVDDSFIKEQNYLVIDLISTITLAIFLWLISFAELFCYSFYAAELKACHSISDTSEA